MEQVDQAISLCSEMHDIKEAIYENKSKLEGIGEDYQIQVCNNNFFLFSDLKFVCCRKPVQIILFFMACVAQNRRSKKKKKRILKDSDEVLSMF